MEKKIFILPLLLVLLAGCAGSKKSAQVPVSPEWIQARPTSHIYYVGIGSARKATDPNGYMQAAKQSALADLASDISINISSNSVLSAFETQQRFFEDYSSTIKADTQKELEGYEIVDTWENETNYWVYYRLSKDLYRKQLEEKKQKASAKSLDFYDKALKSIEQGDVRIGLVFLVKALEPIKPFFAETIKANYNGTDIFLGNEIVQLIASSLNGLSITGYPDLKVKLGQPLTQKDLQFLVNYKGGKVQKGIPLKATYSEKPIAQNKAVTDLNGVASFSVDAVRSSKLQEKFGVSMDLDVILAEATTDFALRKILSRFNVPFSEVNINIIKPSFRIVSIEKNIGTLLSQNIISEAVKRKLIEAAMPIVSNSNEADFVINIDASTVQVSETGGYKQAALSTIISVAGSNGVEVYRKSLDRILGSHFDIEMAGKNAFVEASRKVENSVMREIIEVVVKGKSSY